MIMTENLFFRESPLEHSSGEWHNVRVVGLDGRGWTSQQLLASLSPWIGELMSSLPLHTDHCIILPDVTWKDVSAFFESLKLLWAESGDLAELLKVSPSEQVLAKDVESFENPSENILSIQSESQNQECVQLNEQEQVNDFIKKDEDKFKIEPSNECVKYESFKNESEKTTKAMVRYKKLDLECENCGKHFTTKFSFKRHTERGCSKELIVQKKLDLECKICGKHLETKSSFKRHKERERKKELRLQKKLDLECKLCGLHLQNKSNLKRHMKRGCKKVNCEKCHKVFAKEWMLEKHKLSAKVNCVTNYKIVKSQKLTYSKGYTRRILKSPNLGHILKGTSLISCEECQKQFISYVDLMKHKEKIHPILYSCDYCEYSGNEKRQMRGHHNANHKDIPVPCDKCDKKCRNYKTLNTHIRIDHEGIRFPCDKCNYQSTDRIKLKNHINAIHLKLKLPCNQCDKKYTHPRNLRQHQKSEHEGIIYLCDQCDYKGTQKRSLQNHIEKAHEGIIYQCDKCEYNGTNKRNFNIHIEKYHNEIKAIST